MIWRRPSLILYALFFCSGAAGLGYQLIWVRMLTGGLGHEAPAMLGVASAFLGGLGLGAWILGKRVRESRHPLGWYGGLELLIGGWGIASGLFIPVLNQLALRLTGPAPAGWVQWTVVFALPFLALFPATGAMGATLPAMERVLAPHTAGGRAVGAFYAANTFGAVAGTVAGAFLLMPWLGFRASLFGLGLVSGLCGLIALYLRTREELRPPSGVVSATPARPDSAKSTRARTGAGNATSVVGTPNTALEVSPWRLGVTVLVTGLLGMACQFVGIRLLAQVLENTVYSYAAALAVYLAGTALGATVYQRWGGRWNPQWTWMGCLYGVSFVWLLAARGATALGAVYEMSRARLGDSIASVFVAEMGIAAMLLGPPTFFMGMLFSHLLQAAARSSIGVGRAAALNTFGCALAGGLVGLWLLPWWGTKACVLAIAGAYLLLLPLGGGLPRTRRSWRWMLGAIPILVVGALLGATDLRLVKLPAGARVAAYRESVYGSVAVIETPDEHRSLRVNNRLQMGGTAAALAERRQAHLPLLLHPDPRQALFLGPGTGITLGAAAEHPALQMDGVELVPAILEMMPAFAAANGNVFTNARVRLRAGDARRFVRTTAARYDVVVADLFHPAQDGAGFLYTLEHFEAVRRCLSPGGLFCQWLPLHQLGVGETKAIVRTFLECFPHARAVLLHFNVDIPVLGLLGTEDPSVWTAAGLERRLGEPRLKESLRNAGLDRTIQVLGCLAADASALRAYAGRAEISTDDRPAVLFFAPYQSVRRHAPSFEVLMGFLEPADREVEIRRQVLASLQPGQETFANHLGEFIRARNLYLRGLVEEGEGRLAPAIDRYLESAQRSLYFTPAYARCITIIQVMAATDRPRARALFTRLEAAQPSQPLGRKLLGPLFEENP